MSAEIREQFKTEIKTAKIPTVANNTRSTQAVHNHTDYGYDIKFGITGVDYRGAAYTRWAHKGKGKYSTIERYKDGTRWAATLQFNMIQGVIRWAG